LRKLRVRPPHTLASFWEDHELCVPYLFPFSGAFSGYGLNEIDASNYEETPMICEAVRPRLPWGTKKTPGVTGRVRKTEGRVEGLSVGPTFLLLTDAC